MGQECQSWLSHTVTGKQGGMSNSETGGGREAEAPTNSETGGICT